MDGQSIANWLTAGLGIATVWLAIATQRMATAAKASVDLAAHPYLSIRGLHVSLGSLRDLSATHAGATRLGIRLFNPGKVRITYQIENISASIGGHSVATPKFESTGGVIHPDEETTYFYPLIPSPSPIQAPTDGEMAVTVSYWSVPTEKKSVKAKLRVLVTSQSTHEWLFLEGPEYG